jgi:hypothetical protein
MDEARATLPRLEGTATDGQSDLLGSLFAGYCALMAALLV